jgi:hypothetical protein
VNTGLQRFYSEGNIVTLELNNGATTPNVIQVNFLRLGQPRVPPYPAVIEYQFADAIQ